MPSFAPSTGRLLSVVLATGAFAAVHPALARQTHRASSPQAGQARNLPDSFLPVRALTVGDLVRQIQRDLKVRRHYAQYLRIPESRVAQYVSRNMVVSRLSHSGEYTMYLVRPNSLIYPVRMSLPGGSAVFALRSGGAAMTCGDGNPLIPYKTAEETHYVQAPAPLAHRIVPARVNTVPVPLRAQETIVPTIVATPVYQPASPLTADEQAPAEPTPVPQAPAQQTASSAAPPTQTTRPSL